MAHEEQQPMSDARLQEINNLTADVEAGRIRARFDEETAWLAILDLRRDNERLRAREAALLEVVQAVAFDDPIQPDSGNFVCYYCCACAPYESAVVHSEHCTYEQARALLGERSGEAK